MESRLGWVMLLFFCRGVLVLLMAVDPHLSSAWGRRPTITNINCECGDHKRSNATSALPNSHMLQRPSSGPARGWVLTWRPRPPRRPTWTPGRPLTARETHRTSSYSTAELTRVLTWKASPSKSIFFEFFLKLKPCLLQKVSEARNARRARSADRHPQEKVNKA